MTFGVLFDDEWRLDRGLGAGAGQARASRATTIVGPTSGDPAAESRNPATQAAATAVKKTGKFELRNRNQSIIERWKIGMLEPWNARATTDSTIPSFRLSSTPDI
jgi:hypothetical protein